jgi:hypothetical protein
MLSEKTLLEALSFINLRMSYCEYRIHNAQFLGDRHMEVAYKMQRDRYYGYEADIEYKLRNKEYDIGS